MALKAATMAALTAATKPRGGVNRLFSTSPLFMNQNSSSEQPSSAPPSADPNPNLFVSGLSKRTTTDGLREAFSKFGEVVHAKVVSDRVTGYSKGFGFVKYATTEEAQAGINGMHGQFLDGWVIFAEFAKPRTTFAPPPQNGNSPFGRNGYQ